MEKVKILGIGNDKTYNCFIVRKNKDFFEWLKNLLSILGVDDVDTYYTKNCAKKRKNIDYFVDKHEGYLDYKNNSRIDVFYGKNDVFIAVNMPLQKRKKFMEKLNEISIWAKPKNTKIIKK